MSCPACSGSMTERSYAHARVHRCDGCGAMFLARSELGALIEAENDWHAHQSANTAALPRITSEMSAPPSAPAPSRAFIETLFRA